MGHWPLGQFLGRQRLGSRRGTRIRVPLSRAVVWAHGWWSDWPVGRAVPQHGEQDIDAATGEADEGGVVAPTAGSFAVVASPTVGVFSRREGGEE